MHVGTNRRPAGRHGCVCAVLPQGRAWLELRGSGGERGRSGRRSADRALSFIVAGARLCVCV